MMNENMQRDADGSESQAKTVTYHLRVTEEMAERFEHLTEAETKRIGRPQLMSEIMRQALIIGLDKLERTSEKVTK